MPHISLPEGLPGITSAFAYRPETAKPMRELAEVLLRGANTLSSAERETIATFVSHRNECHFCQASHRAAAAHHQGGDYSVVDAVKADYLTAPISAKLKALLTIAGQVQIGGRTVTEGQVADARTEGATDTEIHDTVLIAAAFSMFNRYVDGLATLTPIDDAAYDPMGQRMAHEGVRAQMSSYLPGVEAGAKPGAYASLIDAAKRERREYSKIWDLFAFAPQTMHHLSHLTQGIMRQPATISDGLRELIAAYTSHQNACRFCTMAHAATASELLGSESLVWAALRDLEGSPLDDKHKALLRFVGKVTRDLPGVWRDDVATLQAHGWDDEAIYFAISVCALFNFYNRWITATGVPEMSEEAHRLQGRNLARGYVRDKD